MSTNILDMERLRSLACDGFTDWEQYGNVRAACNGDLVLFNYTHAAQFEGRWNWFERVSRGLILDTTTGEVVARPFDKFFNWGERGNYAQGHLVTVTEKIDGSLGIHYRDKALPSISTHTVATRGSFESEQATWATIHLRSYYDLCDLPNEYTLLFEIVYPGNRIVVDYGTTEDLYLLAIRNRFTGEYLPFFPDVYEFAQAHGFPTPQVYTFNNVTDILATTDILDGNAEGWVAEFSDGQRFKFKGDRYVEIHRIVTAATFKRVLQEIAQGSFDSMIEAVPDELLDQIHEWEEEIDTRVVGVTEAVEQAFSQAPKDDRKTFALWAKANHADLMPYLFRCLDEQEYRDLIFKLEFRERESQEPNHA